MIRHDGNAQSRTLPGTEDRAYTSRPCQSTASTTSWRLRVAGPACTELSLAHLGTDVWPVHNSSSTFDVFVDHPDVARVTTPDGCKVVEREQGQPGRKFLVPDGYMPPEEMDEVFRLLALTHPDRAQFIDLTEPLGAPPTQEGRHIYALKVSDNVQVDENEPNLLLVGMHHAREIMGPETVLFAAQQLLETEVDKHAALVEGNQIYLAWDWNPDGWRYVLDTDNMWREEACVCSCRSTEGRQGTGASPMQACPWCAVIS